MTKLTAGQAKQVLDLKKYLPRNDELVARSRAVLKPYTDEVEMLDFQTAVVEAAHDKKSLGVELPTGSGKSVVAARVCAERLAKGPCLMVCPSSGALGDDVSGIINKFVRVFNKLGKSLQHGELNDVSLAHDVSFVTPIAFANLVKREPARIKKYLSKISTMIIDEAHHFPEDEDKALVIYGQIERLARKLVKGLVFAMTGTWTRLDGKLVMGQTEPDVRMTVQDSVDLGRAPPLYCMQVFTDAVGGATKHAHLYRPKFANAKAEQQYLRNIADCILETRKHRPAPFAAFAHSRKDAAEIVRMFNAKSKLKAVVMDSGTPVVKRKEYVQQLNAGKLAGYVTCAVGEEALDIPKLEVVHLIRRTDSVARNIQAIGRALRVAPGKKSALVIDYATAVEGLRSRMLGISLDDVAKQFGVRSKRKLTNGGPMVEQDNYDDDGITNIELSLSEERAMVLKSSTKMSNADRIKAFILRYAADPSNPRPTKGMKGWVEIP